VTEVIGKPELRKDERFATPPARAKNAAALTEILESWARLRSKHEVMKALASRGVVCGAVLDTAEVLANSHLRERGTVYDIDHPTRGRFSTIGCPLRLSDSPFAPSRAPLMGEHTEAVLTGLAGYSADEVRALREKRVI
jgi:formyl-CoA transferase